mmetsp:Transcript_3458/g.6953  ORF Transcript_3458/g.6953 Transcript_3458/m.6953 type:complete len:297 (+) Transcript_3458:220-1110(+)
MREEIVEARVDAVLHHELLLEGAVLERGQGGARMHQHLLVRLHDKRRQRHEQRRGRLAERRLRVPLAQAADAMRCLPRHGDWLLWLPRAQLPDLRSLVVVGLVLVSHADVEHLQDVFDHAARHDLVARLHRGTCNVAEDGEGLLAGAGRGRHQQVLEDVDGAALRDLLGLLGSPAGEVRENPEGFELQLVLIVPLAQLEKPRHEAGVDHDGRRRRVRPLHERAQLAGRVQLLAEVFGEEPLLQGLELVDARLLLELAALLAAVLLFSGLRHLCTEQGKGFKGTGNVRFKAPILSRS